MARTSRVDEIMMKFDDSKRIVAKLLAAENITVQVVPGAPTAMFDTVRRVLVIPDWAGLTIDQFDLLMGHEVGHALFTDASIVEKMMKDGRVTKGLHSYWNVVEDARIERKMRNSFPGLTRVFYNGYQAFHQNGPLFKGTKTHLLNPNTGQSHAIADMRLIDRINLFYKIGAFTTVPFSRDEQKWIHRIDACSSMEDALQIARELHKYAKEQEDKDREQAKSPAKSPVKNGEKGEKSQKSKSKPSKSKDDVPDYTANPSDGDGDDDEQDGEGSSSDEGDEGQNDGNGSGSRDESGDDDSDSDGDGGSSDDDADGDESDDDADGDSSGNDGDDDSDEDGDSDSGSTGSTPKRDDSKPKGDKAGNVAGSEHPDPSAATETAAQDTLNQLAQKAGNDFRHLLIAPVTDATFNRRVVTAKTWVESALKAVAGHATMLEKVEDEWNMKYRSLARSMALEFDRKKTARQYQRAQTSKTGRLDMSKLHQYKTAEDLFKRSVTIPDGKSHGIVMIIDGSSSMNGVFPAVVDQTLLFGLFAFLAKIPFEAYMFTTDGGSYLPQDHADLTITLPAGGRLIGLINTVTDRSQFRNQMKAVLALKSRFAIHSTYGSAHTPEAKFQQACAQIPSSTLGGTPLYCGMMLGERAVARMKKTLRLDKMVYVVVSDGDDGNGLEFTDYTTDAHSGKLTTTRKPLASCGRMVVRDTVTKRNFVYADNAANSRYYMNATLSLILEVTKVRSQAETIYMFLCGDTSDAYSQMGMNAMERPSKTMGFGDYATAASKEVRECTKAMTTDGQYVMKAGVADLNILLNGKSLDLQENTFASTHTSGMDADKIGEVFKRNQLKAINGRKFTNAVIPHIA